MSPKQVRKCPICGKPVEPAWKTYPFCSPRCRTIDLGNWAAERYVVHRPLTEADVESDSPEPAEKDE